MIQTLRLARAILTRFAGASPLAALLVAVMILPAVARAQTAPAGNEHPQSRVLASEGKANPFGTPGKQTVAQADKIAFASQLNLDALRDLSVYHNGRVKILGTLARETVSEIAGRKDFIDYLPETVDGKERWKKVHIDTLFTFLDMTIDPQYYDDKPLVGINYLPLREKLLELAIPGGDAASVDARERWKRLGRVSPAMISEHAEKLFATGTTDQQVAKGLNDINEAISLYVRSAGSLLMVPSDAKDKPWTAITDLPAGSPIRAAAADLGAAWRARDASKANAAIAVLATELPKLEPSIYPTTRRSLESFYNRANLFEWGMWLYALAMLSLLLAFGTGRPWLRYLGMTLLVAAIVAHGLGFGLRSYIAERYAIQNQFESMTGLSLFAAIFCLGLLIFKRQLIFGAAAAGTGFLLLIVATQMGIPGQEVNREAAILNTSVLLKYHVTTVLFSYGLITLGLIVAIFYLATHYAAKLRGTASATDSAAAVSAAALGSGDADEPKPTGVAAVLSDMDKAHMTILQLAFWTLGVGILLGAWWADHSWGRWWAFDPKELWALVTWIVYLVVIHVRKAGVKGPGLVTAWLSVLGFIVMLWCYFGVNLLLPGLHAYA